MMKTVHGGYSIKLMTGMTGKYLQRAQASWKKYGSLMYDT